MPTGPGDQILDAIEGGKADDAIMKQYSINGDQLKSFKSLYYGLSNQKMGYNEIGELFPELNQYFKPGSAPKQVQQPGIETPDFTKPVHEKLATESTALPSMKQSKAAADNAKDVESLQQKFDRGAKESLLTINKALASHDDVVNTMIRKGRYNQAKEQALNEFATAPKSDMPAAAQLALERNRISPDKETKPWEAPIAPEETAKLKAKIQGDETQARDFINQVSVHKPEEAKDLQRSMYELDAIARMKEDPNIGIKVNNNLKAINEGKLKYNAVTRQLTEDEGFLPSLVTGIKERTRQMQNYDLFQGNDADVIKLLEKRMASYDPDKPVPVPTGMGEIGQMTGMEWKSLLKGFAVGAVTEPIGGEAAAPYITAAINAPEYYQRGYSTALEDSYKEFRKQGKSPEESLKLSRGQAKTEGKLGAAEGFVSSFIGGRVGLRELPKFNISGGFKNAVNNFIKTSGHGLAETSIEGLADGLVAGYMQDLKDTAATDKGLFRDSEKNIKDNIKGEVYFAFAMAAMTKLGKGMIDTDTYKKIKYWITRQDPKAVESKLGEMVMDGQISKEDADNITQEIKEQKEVDRTVPEDTKDVSRMAMIEKIKERDALEEKKKNVDKALHPEIQEQIDKLNEEILEHSKHKKESNESETKAETQADAEADVKAEPKAAQETSQPEAVNNQQGVGEPAPVADITPEAKDLLEGLKSGSKPAFITKNLERIAKENGIEINNQSTPDKVINQLKAKQNKHKEGKDAVAEGEMHYTNPEGTQYVLRGEDLYHVGKDGKETKFSEKAMQTKSTQELVSKIKEANTQPDLYKKLESLPQEQWQALRNNLPGNKNINTISDMVKAYNNGDKAVVNAVDNTINSKPEHNAIQEQSVERVHVPSSPGDSAQMGAGDESQGTVNEEAARSQKVTPQQATHYEANIGVAPNQQTGRIVVDPIFGGEAKKLYKIIGDMSKGLKQKIIYAKMPPRVLGAYGPSFKGIKIRFNGDLDTTAHELGHAIDDHFDIYTEAAKDPNILQELDQFSSHGSNPPANHPNPRKYIDKEGFAEWLRAHILNPGAARQAAPKTTQLYESKTSPEFQKVVQQFSDDIRTWAGSIGRDQTLSNVRTEYEEQKGLLAKLFKKEETNSDFTINWVDRIAANYLNPLHAFEKAFNYAKGIRGIDTVLPANDPIILSRIVNGMAGKFGEILKTGMIDGQNNVLKDANGNPKNLQWLLDPFDNSDQASIKRDMHDTIAYMISERAVELSGKFQRGEILTGAGAGIYSDFAIAQKTLNEFHNGDPNRLARIQDAANRYREFADDMLKYAVDKGRLSEDQYKQIKADNTQYVAMQRMLETEPGQEIIVYPGKGEKPLGSKAEIIHRQTGSTKATEHPYANLLDILYKAIRESDRNEVMKAFRDILVDPRFSNEGDPKRLADIGILSVEGDKEAIPIFVNGQPEYWRFQKDLYGQLKALDKDAYKVGDLFTMPAKVLRFTTTHFPVFALRNWLRDLQDRMIKSTTGSGFKELVGDKEDWSAIARAGGLNSGYYMKSKEAYYGLLTEAMGDMANKKNTIITDPNRLKHVWHKYEDLLYKGETSNRVAEYRSAFKKAKEQGMDDYNASIFAAFKARDLIDFAIAGHHMQRINQIIPFTNAAVQGLRSAAVSAKENPVGFMGRMFLYSVIPGVASWFYNHRNEDDEKLYEELPAYQRDMFWNFRIGPNNWLSLPKPYELALPQMGIDRALSYALTDKKDAFDGYGGTVAKLLLPFDEGNAAGPYQSVVEGLANKDFFRDRTIIPPDEDALDLSLRHTETGTRIGQLLQNISGWDARKWDHFIQRQFSYTGNFALKLSDIGKDKSRHEFDLSDTGLFKRSPAYNSKSVQNMIDFAKRFNLTRTPPYKNFNKIVGDYFNAESNQQREEIGKQLIDHSKQLLDEWKSRNTDEIQKKKAEAKKASQNR